MGTEVMKAFTMMAIALPTMFLVIVGFIIATTLLRKAFPATDEDTDES
jgi:hypothetical protein